MDLVQFEKNCRSIDVWEILSHVIEKHFDILIQIVQDQLSEGQKETGAMPDYKSDVYAHLKERYVPTYKVYPTTDLRVTGEFYQGIKCQLNLMGITIESMDSKAKGLEKKYGSGIYVPNDFNLKKFIDQIVDEFREDLLKALSKEN
jgi:hypothetical protein